VIVPRGGKSLIARVQKEARVPVIGHLEGVCHVFVERGADLPWREHRAECERCGAPAFAARRRRCWWIAPARRRICRNWSRLLDGGCEVRGDETAARVDARVKPATEQDWYAEYLDAIIAVRVVDDVDAAIAHIGSTARSTRSAS
jgi:glutamate-5-semialdehyde dehydrogenase